MRWHLNGAAVAARTNVTIAWEEREWTPAAGRRHKGSPHGNKPGGESTWLMAIWSGAACMWATAPVRCGDDEKASASSRTARNASELVMSERVKEWRAQHFMENDDDFAYAFASYDQAVVAGGHGLATKWLEVRAEQEEQLIPAAAAVVAALKPGEPSRILSNAPKPVTKPLSRSRRSGVRLHENPGSSPQAVTHRVEVLADVLLGLGALRPSGQLTHGLQQEWSQACRRLSQNLVTQAEMITVTNAVKTYQELQAHMSSRGRRGLPEFLDLDSFLHCGTSTLAPCRALNSIKWLNNNAQLNWEVSGLTAPTAKSKREEKAQQAIVVAPPMMGYLEEQIERLHDLGDHRWTALLSSWLMAVGCLRHIHLTRTRPRRLSKSTLHCSCSRGKQRRLRHGFHFCIPSYFTTGWAWAEHWLKAYEKLAAEVKPKAGLCFDSKGVPWAIKEVTLIAREVFYGQVDNVEWLTTYSWRRWGSTVAHTLKLSDSELAALGDWQNQTDLPQEAKMPLHYSGARYTQSQRVKHRVLEAAKQLAGFESWEMVTEEAAMQAKEVGRRAVDKAIHQDRAVLWSLPITQEEARERFSLAAALKARAAKLRSEAAQSPAVRSMPDEVQGKILSAYLKSGEALCGAFQLGRCQLEEKHCTGQHRCAVLLKTGRICGGWHTASDCWDKRALLVDKKDKKDDEKAAEKEQPAGAPKLPIAPKKRPLTKAKPPEPAGPPPKKKKQVVGGGDPPALPLRLEPDRGGDRGGDAYFDYLAGKQRRYDQAPSAIYRSEAGGVLWLGPLPVAETQARFPRVTLQVTCFSPEVEERGGLVLQGAMHIHIAPSSVRDRTQQWRVQWPLIKNSVQSGEGVLLHCLAGKHRAAGVAVLCRAVLAGESLQEAEDHIKKVRTIDLPGLVRNKGIGEWLAEMRRTTVLTAPHPKVVGCIATTKSKLHLMTDAELPLCQHKQSADKMVDRLSQPMKTTKFFEAAAWMRPTCDVCMGKAPAGVQTGGASWDDRGIVDLACCPFFHIWGRGTSLFLARCDLAGRSDRLRSRRGDRQAVRARGDLLKYVHHPPPFSILCGTQEFSWGVVVSPPRWYVWYRVGNLPFILQFLSAFAPRGRGVNTLEA